MENIIKKLKNKKAFTLIEMLIVLFIIAILLILIIPNITKNIDTAKDNTNVQELLLFLIKNNIRYIDFTSVYYVNFFYFHFCFYSLNYYL